MVNKPRNKGTRGERLWADYLTTLYWPEADRGPLHGGKDKGDTLGHLGICFQVKNYRDPHYPEWVRGVETQRENGNSHYGVVIHKPHGVGKPAMFHAIMETDPFWVLAMQAQNESPWFKVDEHLEMLELSTIRRMDVRAALATVNTQRVALRPMKQFAAVSYEVSKPKFIAMYAYQMLELLHLAGYGTDQTTHEGGHHGPEVRH